MRLQGELGPFNFSMPSRCCCVPPAGTSKGQASCEGATLPPLVEALALGVTLVVQVGDAPPFGWLPVSPLPPKATKQGNGAQAAT